MRNDIFMIILLLTCSGMFGFGQLSSNLNVPILGMPEENDPRTAYCEVVLNDA